MLQVSDDKIAAISFGSNQGDSAAIVRGAIAALRSVGSILKISPWYRTPPVGPVQPDYLNGCLLLHYPNSSETLLKALLGIEAYFGRTRTVRWGARTLDLDLLFKGSEVMDTEFLTLPHPRMHERAFVLVPLADIYDTWVHPTLQESVQQLLTKVDPTGIRPYHCLE